MLVYAPDRVGYDSDGNTKGMMLAGKYYITLSTSSE